MKAKIKNIIALAILASTFTACDLDVVPPSDIAVENFWKTEKDAWYGLNACYSSMDGLDIWDELCTDNGHSINLGKATLNCCNRTASVQIKVTAHIASA